MSNIIAVANQKGGVGITTTVVHLAYYFANRGSKVLVVDLDTQGHVALSYNNDRGDALRDVLLRRRGIPDAVVEVRPNLWIVANSKYSEELVPYQMNMRQRVFSLAWILRHPAKMQPVIGVMNLDRLRDCCRAAEKTLTREE